MFYSFDIFDTLLTRKTATPSGIFAIMQYELQTNNQWDWIPIHVRNNYHNLRIAAEREARKSYRKFTSSEEISLCQIYSFLPLNTSDSSKLEQLMLLEIETELKYSLGIQDNINRFLSLLSQGNKVVLISDMYLPEKVIRDLLCQQSTVFFEIPIYVSSEIGVTKASGRLFKYVSDKEHVSFKEWVHIGDNVYSDFRRPRKLGIDAELFSYVDLNNIEKKLLAQYSNNPQVQLSIGVSKNIRLQHLESSKQYKLGSSLGGPLLVPYVQWILNDAKERGINRLYFIARDGYILKMIADEIIRKSCMDISTNYIYGSRIAWRLFYLDSKYINDISSLSSIHTISDLVNQFLEGMGGEAPEYGLTQSIILKSFPPEYRDESKFINKENVIDILNNLSDNTEFMQKYNSCITSRRKLIRNYFRQEIDCSNQNFAMVDLNGSGVTLNLLRELLSDYFPEKLKCYFMFNQFSPLSTTNVDKIVYAINGRNYFEIELLCRALHGQTLGYCENNAKFIPILEEGEEQSLAEWSYDDYVSGVLQFAKKALETPIYSYGDGYELYLSYLNLFYKDYDKETIDLLSTIPFSWKSLSSVGVKEYAPRVFLIQLVADFVRARGDYWLHTNNLYMSMKRSSPLLRFILKYGIDDDGFLHQFLLRVYDIFKS